MNKLPISKYVLTISVFSVLIAAGRSLSAGTEIPKIAYEFLENHCLDCHDALEQKGDFNLEELAFDLSDPPDLRAMGSGSRSGGSRGDAPEETASA